MHNMVYLIGRLTENPTVEKENDREVCTINLAVQRTYKNEEGIYETDFLKCILWNDLATHTAEYCKKGDLVGIKGRIQNTKYENNGDIIYKNEIVVDRISFLASKGVSNEE